MKRKNEGTISIERRKVLRRIQDQDAKKEIEALQAQIALAREELAKLERIKPLAAAASSVVHDIRNSLGVISSTAQFVLNRLKPDEKERQAWELVERNVESIKEILKAYLGLARQVEEQKQAVTLNEIVERVLKFVEHQCRKQNIRVEKNLDPNLPAVLVAVSSIESAVLNIILNAIEAMENGGALKCKSEKHDKKVALTIEDTGPGIPPEVMNKIFTAFFTTKNSGSGMGLYSAKAVIENNDGEISCESKVGVGTKMILSFPAVAT